MVVTAGCPAQYRGLALSSRPSGVVDGERVAAARHEPRPGDERARRVAVDPGRDDPEAGSGDDVDEVGGRPDEVHDEVALGVVGMEADRGGVMRRPAQVGIGSGDVQRDRRERRGMSRIDQAQPAPDDVRRSQRAAIREGQVRPEMERDLPSAVGELPRCGQGRTDLEVRVERCQRLEQLGRDGRAAGVALGGRIERGRLAGQDPHGTVRGGRCRPPTRGEQRREHDESDQAAHRREYRAGRPKGLRAAPAASGRAPGMR